MKEMVITSKKELLEFLKKINIIEKDGLTKEKLIKMVELEIIHYTQVCNLLGLRFK